MIPFLDLRAQYRSLQPELEAAIICALRSCDYVLGPCVEDFEARFAEYCGTRHAIAVNSGTSALHLALLAADIGPGDEVITVPMTFVATVAAIVYSGATPVFVDIDPETWTMDAARIGAAVTSRTRAIMPVHLHGRLADMAAINAVARRHGLLVIEDAAQAHGAERGPKAGALGDIGCFSFYPGKNLGACGEGGAVTTDRADIAAKVRSLRDWGQQGKYNHVRQGFNYRMDTLQGAALGVKLPRLDGWNAARRRICNAYHAGLGGRIGKPSGPFAADHACHVYAIRVADPSGTRTVLRASGIATNVHYPRPVHLQTAYENLGYAPGDFPESEALARETLSLPLFPELSEADVRRVISTMNALAADPLPLTN